MFGAQNLGTCLRRPPAPFVFKKRPHTWSGFYEFLWVFIVPQTVCFVVFCKPTTGTDGWRLGPTTRTDGWRLGPTTGTDVILKIKVHNLFLTNDDPRNVWWPKARFFSLVASGIFCFSQTKTLVNVIVFMGGHGLFMTDSRTSKGNPVENMQRPQRNCRLSRWFRANVQCSEPPPWFSMGAKGGPMGTKERPKERKPKEGDHIHWWAIIEFIDGNPLIFIWRSIDIHLEIHWYSLMVSINEYRWIFSSLKSNSLKNRKNHKKNHEIHMNSYEFLQSGILHDTRGAEH